MHIANLNHQPDNTAVNVDSYLTQLKLREVVSHHEPLVLALTDLNRTINEASLTVRAGSLRLSEEQRQLIKECSHFLTSATAIIIIASNHEYSTSQSAVIIKNLLELSGRCFAKVCPESFLLGIIDHVLHERGVDLKEAFFVRQSAAELLVDVAAKFEGNIQVGIGDVNDFQVHKWSAKGFFDELKSFALELKQIGYQAINTLGTEVVRAKLFRR